MNALEIVRRIERINEFEGGNDVGLDYLKKKEPNFVREIDKLIEFVKEYRSFMVYILENTEIGFGKENKNECKRS